MQSDHIDGFNRLDRILSFLNLVLICNIGQQYQEDGGSVAKILENIKQEIPFIIVWISFSQRASSSSISRFLRDCMDKKMRPNSRFELKKVTSKEYIWQKVAKLN